MNKGVKRIASLFLAVVMLFSTMVVTTSAADVENVGALLDSYEKAAGHSQLRKTAEFLW